MSETPPEGISEDEKPDASTSQELPVVVLGDVTEADDGPRSRVLLGRIEPRYVIYPAMLSQFFAGSIATFFAFQSAEWSVAPIILTWTSLFLWTWFYSIAYRYRRRVLKWSASLVLVSMSVAVAAFCFDRSAAQFAFDGSALVERTAVPSLSFAAVLTIVGAAIIVSHIVFFGRGYREKRG